MSTPSSASHDSGHNAKSTSVAEFEETEKSTTSSHSHCCDEKDGSNMLIAERMVEAFKKAKLGASADKSESARQSSAVSYLCRNNIMKRTLHVGSKEMPIECQAAGGGVSYPAETKFIFDYRIRDPDDPEVFLDDTKKYGKRMELYSGKDFQLEFWEHCLGTMLIGEVASFLVPKRCLGSFPTVNKKLRDYMLDKIPGGQGGVAKHTCGFMSLREQGGLGYPDLDSLMMSPKTLEFIFELISVDLPNKVRKETWIMNAEEKAATVPKLRKEGNDLYGLGKWYEAAAKYEEALGLLEQLLLREKPGDPEYIELDNSRIPFFVNMAQCQFKIKDYYGAIRSSSEALSRDYNNTKALFRRALSYSATADLELAEQDYRRLLMLAPELGSVINKELVSIVAKRKACKDEERRRLAGKMFNGSAKDDS